MKQYRYQQKDNHKVICRMEYLVILLWALVIFVGVKV